MMFLVLFFCFKLEAESSITHMLKKLHKMELVSVEMHDMAFSSILDNIYLRNI